MLELVAQEPDIFIVELASVAHFDQRRHPGHCHPLEKGHIVFGRPQFTSGHRKRRADTVPAHLGSTQRHVYDDNG